MTNFKVVMDLETYYDEDSFKAKEYLEGCLHGAKHFRHIKIDVRPGDEEMTKWVSAGDKDYMGAMRSTIKRVYGDYFCLVYDIGLRHYRSVVVNKDGMELWESAYSHVHEAKGQATRKLKAAYEGKLEIKG